MSFLMAQPEVLDAIAGELHSINEAVREGNSAVAVPTTGVAPAAADVVSILTAAQFSWHAKLFQEISAEAAAVREQLATMLGVSAGSYAATEVANTAAVG
ncbi:PE family protein [Mycobacterium nebraskense]|uniref:PE family protein n=1 Tax=Mycobacterium nebraskense TaxID=244292 RepID=A0A0F5N836_9MYCO|nr:PE family protein [Mycobacterium nebraskense]KKC02438.1 PE family protein [Mycobacterium nebraskense]KLO43829.1 PE family protein [Mycobacterium nebraskense]MBI2697166.1 PE family protein [Mycobacterium nebraskense]MCV7116094.1 PE family protein [Mycobacterium nebraskense]ORW21112.1 PE family protein [Mycobacterium nebraskense]